MECEEWQSLGQGIDAVNEINLGMVLDSASKQKTQKKVVIGR